MSNLSFLPAHGCLPEPDLLFHPERPQDRSPHPLLGLLNFGPFSRSIINPVMDPIRLGVIVPTGGMDLIRRFVSEFEREHQPRERRVYLPPFPGFARTFGLRLMLAPSALLELPVEVERRLGESPKPHAVLAEELVRGLGVLQARRGDFDVILIYLPRRWGTAFEGGEGEDFDLHDHIKAVSAMRGIPTQILLEEKALTYPCRASVMWRLGIALYTKAGGVPWKLAETPVGTAYIGLSYAIRPQPSVDGRFVTCCSQVFDSDGAGLEFLLYETDDAFVVRDNPFLSRTEMHRVMARSLALYQRRHAGEVPKRIVVHKTTEYKPEEIEGCFDALSAIDEIELVQVKESVPWRAVKLERPPTGTKGAPARYPVERGSYLALGGREVLLWTQGNAPGAVGGKDFFKEGKGIPGPLELVRFAGHGGWEDTCRSVLGLTKMDWNNDSLYDRFPVTLGYATVLAQIVKRMSHLGSRPYNFRFFM